MHCITEINFCHFNLEFRLPAWSLTSPTWESLPLRNRRSWWILHTQTLDLDTLHFCFSSEREMDSVSLVGEKEITYFILIENLTLMTILLHKSSNILYVIHIRSPPRGAASGMSRCNFFGWLLMSLLSFYHMQLGWNFNMLVSELAAVNWPKKLTIYGYLLVGRYYGQNLRCHKSGPGP